uniref:Uncharacterized protein n=1 Tax=Steinernema glaseri TaxID=37863 RepID=A0A1I7YF68_9BILA
MTTQDVGRMHWKNASSSFSRSRTSNDVRKCPSIQCPTYRNCIISSNMAKKKKRSLCPAGGAFVVARIPDTRRASSSIAVILVLEPRAACEYRLYPFQSHIHSESVTTLR